MLFRLYPMNTHAIRMQLTIAGYSAADIDAGLAYAAEQGASDTREGFVLATSRILYSDAQLADGMRFSIEQGHVPNALGDNQW